MLRTAIHNRKRRPLRDISFSMMLQPEKSGAGCNYCKVNRFSIGCIVITVVLFSVVVGSPQRPTAANLYSNPLDSPCTLTGDLNGGKE